MRASINVRLSSEHKEVLEKMAEKESRSLSNYVKLILEKHIHEQNKNRDTVRQPKDFADNGTGIG